MTLRFAGLAAILAALGLFAAGCGGEDDAAPEGDAEQAADSQNGAIDQDGMTDQDGSTEHRDDDEHRDDQDDAQLDPEIEAALADLSEEDRQLALQQGVCPISGQPLGSMGTPVAMTLDGERIFLCCSACEPQVEADPQAVLAEVRRLREEGQAEQQ